MLNTVQLFQLPAKTDQFLKTLQTVLNPLVLEKNKLRFFASLNFKDYILSWISLDQGSQDWVSHLYKSKSVWNSLTGSLVLSQFSFLYRSMYKQGKSSFEPPSPEVSCFTWGLCRPPKIPGETCLLAVKDISLSSWSLGTGVRCWGRGGQKQKSFPVVWYSHNSSHFIRYMLVTKLFLG